MKKPVQEDMKLYPDAMKAPLFFSIVLHAMILLLFGAGMGFQSGGPGKVEVMYVSLVQTSDPVRTLDPGPRTQDPGSINVEESFKVQRSMFNAEETKPEFEKETFRTVADEPTISNFQFPISNFESRISNPEPVAVTAYAGELIPAGMLGSGEKADAGFIHYPPVTISLPRPPYPLTSRRKGEEGTVTLSFLVYSDGTVGEISVVESSGYPRLDKAASRTLRSALFRPVSESGLLVTSNRKIAFSFRLED